ncbi:universal stress protein, partial [Tamlana crocina]|nr:universal stress protein [Tamlana crocina]
PQYIYDQRTEDRKKEAAFVQQCAEDIKQKYDLPAEGVLIEGSIAKAIKQKVEEHKIDLVVAGHKRKGFLYNIFTTNRKKDLIDELNIPLLAVPVG